MPYRILINDHNIHNLFAYSDHTNVQCDMHLHMSMEFILVTEGTLNMTIGNHEYSITQGFGAFVAPFEPHQFRSKQPNNCIVLIFQKESAPHYFDYLSTHTAKSHVFSYSQDALALIKHTLDDNIAHTPFKAQAILAPIFYCMSECCNFAATQYLRDDLLVKASEYLNAHYTENVTLESTAKALGVHPVTISKTFAQKARVNFNNYLNYLRCTHAAALLQNPEFTCAEAAFSSGFGSIRSFNRTFRLIYDVTPLQFKATHTTTK